MREACKQQVEFKHEVGGVPSAEVTQQLLGFVLRGLKNYAFQNCV